MSLCLYLATIRLSATSWIYKRCMIHANIRIFVIAHQYSQLSSSDCDHSIVLFTSHKTRYPRSLKSNSRLRHIWPNCFLESVFVHFESFQAMIYQKMTRWVKLISYSESVLKTASIDIYIEQFWKKSPYLSSGIVHCMMTIFSITEPFLDYTKKYIYTGCDVRKPTIKNAYNVTTNQASSNIFFVWKRNT